MEEEWTLARIDSLECSFRSLVERGRRRATRRTLYGDAGSSREVVLLILLLLLLGGAVLAG